MAAKAPTSHGATLRAVKSFTIENGFDVEVSGVDTALTAAFVFLILDNVEGSSSPSCDNFRLFLMPEPLRSSSRSSWRLVELDPESEDASTPSMGKVKAICCLAVKTP